MLYLLITPNTILTMSQLRQSQRIINKKIGVTFEQSKAVINKSSIDENEEDEYEEDDEDEDEDEEDEDDYNYRDNDDDEEEKDCKDPDNVYPYDAMNALKTECASFTQTNGKYYMYIVKFVSAYNQIGRASCRERV